MPVQVLYRDREIERDYIIRVPHVTEAQFDDLTTEDTAYELLDNVLIVHSPASVHHERVGSFLSFLLTGFVGERSVGLVVGSRAVLHLAPGRKVEPDLMFLSSARGSAIGEQQVEGTADLVVEIISPSTRSYDLGEKRRAYREAATPEIWFVDPARKRILVEVRRGQSCRARVLTRGILRSAVLPGFFIEVRWLWSRPLPNPLTCLKAILAASR
jgi:Uma2 family endonuclease